MSSEPMQNDTGNKRTSSAVDIDGRPVTVTGRFLKMAAFKDEPFIDGSALSDPSIFLHKLSTSALRADIFTFPSQIQESEAKHPYYFEWDNVAAATMTTYADWWENKIPQESRKNCRRATKRGVIVRVAPFDDQLIRGIKGIYDEAPVRQGRRFWHFGKDLHTVKNENGTYLERSQFIGAYLHDELVGFMKLVYVGRIARIMQILAKTSHYDKRPMNALLAKAVEICHDKRMSHLVYSKFTFGSKTKSQLAEFKRRNGFEQLNFPRYYVPLTVKGRVALALRLHRDLLDILPSGVIALLLRARAAWLKVALRARLREQLFASDASVPR